MCLPRQTSSASHSHCLSLSVEMYHICFAALASVLACIGCATATADLGWAPGWQPADTTATDILVAKGLFNLAAYEAQGHKQANCSLANAAVRREWYAVLLHEFDLRMLLTVHSGRHCSHMRGRHILMRCCAFSPSLLDS